MLKGHRLLAIKKSKPNLTIILSLSLVIWPQLNYHWSSCKLRPSKSNHLMRSFHLLEIFLPSILILSYVFNGRNVSIKVNAIAIAGPHTHQHHIANFAPPLLGCEYDAFNQSYHPNYVDQCVSPRRFSWRNSSSKMTGRNIYLIGNSVLRHYSFTILAFLDSLNHDVR